MPRPTSGNGYGALMKHLERYPQGAPPSELLTKILALLLTNREAELVARLPMHPFPPALAARVWGVREVEAYRILEGLAERALLLDHELDGEKLYVVPPPLTGFFDFALMRSRKDIDQPTLCRLLDQYLNQEEGFFRELFASGRTRVSRVLVAEDQVSKTDQVRLFDYERASEIIRGAGRIGVGTCSCRQKTRHLGRACSAAMETCMVFDSLADSLIRHGTVREIDSSRCLELLQECREQNLVQLAENVQSGVTFICNCCSCCCDALVRARKFSPLQPVIDTNYKAEHKPEGCSGCGRCVDACPAEALLLVSANDPQHPWLRRCVQDRERCLGCGTCVRVCHSGAVALAPKEGRTTPPVDDVERLVLMALERGKLQHFIWENPAMAAVAGAVLRVPIVKRTLAASQLGTRYLRGVMLRQAERSSRMPMRP